MHQHSEFHDNQTIRRPQLTYCNFTTFNMAAVRHLVFDWNSWPFCGLWDRSSVETANLVQTSRSATDMLRKRNSKWRPLTTYLYFRFRFWRVLPPRTNTAPTYKISAKSDNARLSIAIRQISRRPLSAIDCFCNVGSPTNLHEGALWSKHATKI